MNKSISIAIIGDFNPHNRTHLATNAALDHAATALGIEAEVQWQPTAQLEREGSARLQSFAAIWCSPGSPYVSMEGALAAIRFARESAIPFFGT